MSFSGALGIALPELILAIGALVLLVLGAFRGDRSTGLVSTGAGLVLVVAVVGFIIGQAQAGKKFSFKDPSDEKPAAHVYELMGQSAPSGD